MSKKKIKVLLISIIVVAVFCAILYRPALPLPYLIDKYTDETSKFMTIEGVNVHYREQGSGSAILLIHGTASSLHTWDIWTETLSKNHRVIRLDLPAFGLTGPFKDGDYGIPHYAAFIKKFLDKLQLNELDIIGNSLGGHIAIKFTQEYPEMVTKMVLLNASGIPTNKESPFIFRIAKSSVGAFIIKNTLPKFIIRNNVEAVYFDDALIDESLVTRYYELALREGNRQAFIDKANTPAESLSDLSAIQQETLIIWGAHDQWIPVENAYLFQERLPNNQLVILNNAGHVPMEEIPKETVQISARFLDDR